MEDDSVEGGDAASHSLNSGNCASRHVDILTAWLAFVSQNSGECAPDYQGRECPVSGRKQVNLPCFRFFSPRQLCPSRKSFPSGIGSGGAVLLRIQARGEFPDVRQDAEAGVGETRNLPENRAVFSQGHKLPLRVRGSNRKMRSGTWVGAVDSGHLMDDDWLHRR